MISHKHKCIFIHYPKTGGETINFHLCGERHPKDKHAKLSGYNSKFENYFKFTFARNPFDQVVSFYFHLRRKPHFTPDYSRRIANDSSFSDYCKLIIQQAPRFRDNQWYNPHYSYLLDKNNKTNIDFIGRFENFEKDFYRMCDLLGIKNQKLSHKNKSKHKHYTEYYDDETREIVAKRYAKDIKYFGYKFGG